MTIHISVRYILVQKKTFIENCADDIVANGVEHFENSNLEVKTVIYSH